MKFFDLGRPAPEKSNPRDGDRRKTGSDAHYSGLDRRAGVDRRGLGFGLKFKTERAIGPIEDWLHEHMPHQHRLTIEGMSDDLTTKEVRVVFAREDQRVIFKAALSHYIKTASFR
ncbi:MAG: hypothetical protein RH946_18545 [Rhodospirillales bacterium]